MKMIRIAFSCAVLISSSSLAQNSLSPSPAINLIYNGDTSATWPTPEKQRNPFYLMTEPSLPAQHNNAAPWLIKLESISSHGNLYNNFSIEGVQKNYWLENGQGQIEMTITAHEHLLFTAYLHDLDAHEKVQTAVLINNRTENLILPLNNLAAGNYHLIIIVLATDHRAAIETFYVELTNTIR
jgi:hypothetical protein